jgi:hypothetical protein
MHHDCSDVIWSHSAAAVMCFRLLCDSQATVEAVVKNVAVLKTQHAQQVKQVKLPHLLCDLNITC